MNEDELVKKLRVKADEMNEIISEHNSEDVYYPSIVISQMEYATPKTDILLDELTKDMKNKLKKLNKERSEVEVMLSACDTYEQREKVLKSYKIIDNSGRMN